MSREIMQQTLDALKLHLTHHEHGCVYLNPVMYALEAALAPPEPTACGYDETVGMCTNNPCCEQTPVSQLWECIGRWSSYLALNGEKANLAPPEWLVDAVKAATAQPEQEPVAWLYNGHLHECDPSEWAVTDVIPLYKLPPHKPWVGLTDGEINTIANSPQPIDETSSGYVLPFAHAIEARLKEINR